MTQGRIASLTLLATSAFLALPAAAFDPWKDEARYEFVYRIDVASIAAAAYGGALSHAPQNQAFVMEKFIRGPRGSRARSGCDLLPPGRRERGMSPH